MLPVVEPCGAHGIALIKGKSLRTASYRTAAHGLCCFLRFWKNADAFRSSLTSIVSETLVVESAPMPDEIRSKNFKIIEQVLGGREEMAFLFKKGRRGELVMGTYLLRLETVADIVELGDEGGAVLRHYCSVEDGSPEHLAGWSIGTRCCETRTDSVHKVASALVNLFVHARWGDGESDRWFYVIRVFKLILFGFLAASVLPEALRRIQTTFKVDESMVAFLTRQLEADNGNFFARTRLRLLRLTRTFCGTPLVRQHVAILATVLGKVDPVLMAILGAADRPRAPMSSLIAEKTGVLPRAEQRLLDLLVHWGPGAEAWLVLEAIGGGFDDSDVRAFARSEALHLVVGLHIYYVYRLASPPLSLLKAIDPSIHPDRQLRIAVEFWRTPMHCLSLFGRRLREGCHSPSDVLVKAREILLPFDSTAFLSIDASEREHHNLRSELRSAGVGRNFTAAANRMCCRKNYGRNISATAAATPS